jgi:hypothetical protein
MNDPSPVLSQLSADELIEISERAGYPPTMSPVRIRNLFVDNEFLRENGDRPGIRYDEGLSAALADYVVWNNPEVMSAAGSEVAQLLNDRIGRAPLDLTAIPGVLTLSSGLAPDDDAGDLRGHYRIGQVQYHSAIGERRYGAPNGKIALRETHIEPEDRV